MNIPSYSDREPNEIIREINHYESSGRIFKALSWLDYAKKNNCVSALEYAALETRLSIEHIIFEQIVVSVGTELDKQNYNKCTGSASKMTSLVEKLNPQYEALVNFTVAMAPKNIPISKWNNRELIKYSGKVSEYLHWSGGIDTTAQSSAWLNKGVSVVEEAANYIWHKITTGNTGVMLLNKLEPEMLDLWLLYSSSQMSLEEAVRIADTLEPVLQERINNRSRDGGIN